MAQGLETNPEGETRHQAWNHQGFHPCLLCRSLGFALLSMMLHPSFDNKMAAVPGLTVTHNRRKTILSSRISFSRNSLKISPHVLLACPRIQAFS